MHISCGLLLGFAGCYTTRNVGGISRIVSVCLFNDYQEPSHRICSLSLFGFLYPRLLEDAVKCAWGEVIARVPGNCDSALLPRVLILSVASSLVYPVPAVPLDYPYYVSDFHSASVAFTYIIAHFHSVAHLRANKEFSRPTEAWLKLTRHSSGSAVMTGYGSFYRFNANVFAYFSCKVVVDFSVSWY